MQKLSDSIQILYKLLMIFIIHVNKVETLEWVLLFDVFRNFISRKFEPLLTDWTIVILSLALHLAIFEQATHVKEVAWVAQKQEHFLILLVLKA